MVPKFFPIKYQQAWKWVFVYTFIVQEKPAVAVENLLSRKLKGRHEKGCEVFLKRKMENKVHTFTEDVLFSWFPLKSSTLKPSSWWWKHYLLKARLDLMHISTILLHVGYQPKQYQNLIFSFCLKPPDKQYLLVMVKFL